MSISISASMFSEESAKPTIAVKIIPAPMSSIGRRPFHLAMLLDVSGSMDGERITALRRTLNLLVDGLCNNDIITLITYNALANVCADCIVIGADTRETLHSTINSLIAYGGTNIEAAILSLLELAGNSAKPNVDAVFILTDGHINSGMSSSAGLLRLLMNQMNLGVPINTLGYGADHNSRLLRDIALRSNGSYTYADAAEVLPAIIGDIMGGLESEVGRQGQLLIPAGWNCLELQPIQDEAYRIGTLIAEKPQWIVLEGEVGAICPSLVFTWKDTLMCKQSQDIQVGNDISMLEIVEQRERCKVANVFAAVMEDVEHYRMVDARNKLNDLSTGLSSSLAKDTTFVIRLQAQVDDMIMSIKPVDPPVRRSADRNGVDVGGMVSRLASHTTVLVNQRGIMSPGTSCGNPCNPSLFSSPSQRSASNRLATAYSSQSTQSQSQTDTQIAAAVAASAMEDADHYDSNQSDQYDEIDKILEEAASALNEYDV